MSDNITPNNNEQNTSGSNKHIAEIITIVLLLAVLVFFLYQCSNNRSTSSNSGTIAQNQPQKVVIQNERGNQADVIDSNISFRDVKFASSIDDIKKQEEDLPDTLTPSENDSFIATSQDGYTYLTYHFNTDTAPSLYGASVNTSDINSELMYVFKNDNLIEVRYQYGQIEKNSFDAIIANVSSEYGTPTYSRDYSNGSTEAWWKNSEVTLSVVYQGENGTSLYYRMNQ